MGNVFIGLDIAKLKIDVALLINGKYKTKVIKNNKSGFEDLIIFLSKFVESAQIHACCEATNVYWEPIAYWLSENHPEIKMAVVNPMQIANYSKVVLSRTKTDITDAKLIADFCQKQQPESWQPDCNDVRLLQSLTRDIDVLIGMRTKEHNRLQVAHSALKEKIQHHIDFINGQIDDARQQVLNLILNNQHLAETYSILQSIPGFGSQSVPVLLTLLANPDKFKSRSQITAFVGLSPAERQSGKSVRGRTSISKIGRSEIRKALYMPALVAYSRIKIYRPYVERLKAAGKHPKVIIVALMRKLLLIAYSCVKNRCKFDKNFYAGVDAP